MKKIILSACAILVALATFAQSKMAKMPVKQEIKSYTENVFPTNVQSSSSIASASAIWSEDFVGGIPTTWTNSTAPWVYRGPSTTPGVATGTQGAYGTNQGPIQSPTASNGFIIFDSGYYDNNGSSSTMGQGMYPSPHNGDLKTDMIDLSGYTDLAVKMNSFFRTFQGQAKIKFYINGTYDSEVEVHTDLDVNDASANDDELIVRMPPSVPGNSDVQLEFQFDGTTQSNVNGSGYYFWILDDIEILPTPLNLIEIQETVVGGFHIDYSNYIGQGLNDIYGLDYTVTPTTQLANHPFVIEGIIRNKGAADQTSMLKYEVMGAGSYLGSSSPTSVIAYSTVNTLDSVIVSAAPSLSPPIGQYGVAIWAESDSVGVVTAVSDTTYKLLEVTDYIYGKDLGEANSTSSWIVGGPGDQWYFSTRFEMYADEQLHALRAYITDESVVGAMVKAVLYESDSTATNGVFFLDESDNYTITTSDLGSWVDISFVNPISLFSGYAYEFGIAGFQHPNDSVFVGTSGESMYNGEHSLFDEQGLNPNEPADAGTPTWYYTTNTPMVRMNFEPIIPSTISEFGVSMFDVYPNPSLGSFTISLEESGEFAVSVINVLGQTVYATVIDSKLTKVNLTGISKGIYNVELSSGDILYTEKLIIE